MTIATINPATGETIKVFDAMSGDEIQRRIEHAARAFASWRTTTFEERAHVAEAVGSVLDIEREEIAHLMTEEMGKTLAAARAEVTKCAYGFRYYAHHARELLAEVPVDTVTAAAVGASHAFLRYEPLGPILAVMPWNFPLWQVTRFAAPALMAGNVILLKHASNVPQTAMLIEDILVRAGAPDGVAQTLLIGSEAVEGVLADPRVRAATCTGSTAAGAAVGSLAGRYHKKSVLELGGSDPYIVLPSADVDEAARMGVQARCQNNGQSCIAAKRFIVHEAIADEFERQFVAAMSALDMGDPTSSRTDVGPLATEEGRTILEEQVADALAHGATLLCGGRTPSGPGWFYPPTVLRDLTAEMRIHQEEVFGPVAQLYRVGTVDEAIGLANATPFGLGANVWTKNPAEQDRCIRELDAGMVFVNGMTTSYPELPFGGVKDSGYGRELSALGIREFCSVKTIWVR